MADPDESSIASVCEFTGLDPVIDRELVVAALKDKNGNIETVVAAFYDDEVKFRQSYMWNESHFMGDREDNGDNPNRPPFNVQGPDEGPVIHGVLPGGPGAPSRPPSRSQSPLGRMLEWSAQTNAAGTLNAQSQEDSELQRALAASVSDIHPPQETGITGGEADTSLPFFGPANRETYDLNQWAMVRTTPESQELSASARKRAPEIPAFLRSRKDQADSNNLNAILTILHAIPGIRNALLQSGEPSRNYGQSPDWWRGSPIPFVGDAEQDNAAVPGDDSAAENAREFTEEIHRVMAFLDSTDRTYGTADNLANAKIAANSWDDNLDRLFLNFFKESNPPDISEKLFSDIGIVSVTNMEDCSYTESYGILDAKIEKGQYFGKLQDIYSVLDTIYWVDLTGTIPEPENTAKMAVSTRLGMIQVFSIGVEGLEGPLDIPEYFYPDRYMAENRELALQIQLKLRSVCQTLKASERVRDRITTFMDKGSNFTLSQTTLSEQAIELGLQKLWQLKAAALWRQHEESVGTPDEFDFSLADVDAAELKTPEEVQVAKAIQAEISVHRKKLIDINKKLQRLQEEKQACEDLLTRLRKRNTAPSEADGWAPTHRYGLRGIIVSSTTFYMCRRETSGDAVLDQWWRIFFDASASEPMSVEKTTLEVAQAEAFKGSGKPIIIYANEAAMEEAPEPLSDALRTFVRFDNRYFKQELASESPRERKRMPAETPTSPSKRQQRSNSMDSMATNKASVGEMSDRAMSDVPLVADAFTGEEVFVEDIATEGVVEGVPPPYEEREREHESALGSEMVQLAISRQKRPEGSEDSQETKTSGGSEGAGEGKPSQEMGKGPAAGEIAMLADWECPEGRYVGHVGNGAGP